MNRSSPPEHVAIVGAGPTVSVHLAFALTPYLTDRIEGLVLALALKEVSIRYRIFEELPEGYDPYGSITLSPNALRIAPALTNGSEAEATTLKR